MKPFTMTSQRHKCIVGTSCLRIPFTRPHFALAKFSSVALLTLLVLLSGCHDNNGDSSAPPPPAAVAPSITSQPSNQSITAGQSASFSVTASGTAPLSYQWQRDGVAISGATSSTYALSSTATTDSGAKFIVVVSNSAGSVTSNAGTLTVAAPSTVVSAAAGGQVTSDDGRVTLSIPANALTADATVTISAPGTDWTVPASLPAQFTVVPGTTRVISTQGGAFDPAVSLNISFSIAGLPASQSASRADSKLAARAKTSARARAAGAATTPWSAFGVAEDCGDGKPVIIILPPPDSYGTGTFIAGCPAPVSTSVVTWTPPASQPPAPSGTVIWDTPIQEVDIPGGDVLVCTSCTFYTRGDTLMGSTPFTIAATLVPDYNGTKSLIALLDGNGQLLAQDLLPTQETGGSNNNMTNILLDGPGNFYLTLGSNTLTYFVSRYARRFAASGPAFQKVWESTLTGVAVTNDGTADTPNVIGTMFAVDPTTGELVGLAGNGTANGQLSSDDKARLRSSADAFVVRLNRNGQLAWATPVVATQTPSYGGAPLSPARYLGYSLNIDQTGDTYVATTMCCAAQNQDGLSGLTLKKIAASGELVWEAEVAGPDQVGSPVGIGIEGYYEGYSGTLAVDQSNNAYVTYYRDNVSGNADSSHLYVAKVSADTGAVSGIGYIDPAVEAARFAITYARRGLSSYIDERGILYLPIDFLGSPSTSELIALDPALNLLDKAPLPLQQMSGGFQVDSSGNIYQQQSSWNGPPNYIVDMTKFHF